MHEALELREAEPVQLLLVADRTQSDDAQRLGLTPGEERRAVGARQQAHLRADRPDLRQLAPVGTRPLVEDLLPDPLLDPGLEAARQQRKAIGELGTQLGHGLLLQVVQRGFPQLLAGIEEGLVQPIGEEPVDRGLHLGIAGRRSDLHLGYADLTGEGIDGVADAHDLLLRELERLDHALLRDLLGARLDHDDRVPSACNHQVQAALLHLRNGGVDHQLTVEATHPDRADGALKGDLRDAQRGGGAHDRQHGRIGILVHGEHGGDHLHVVAELLGEERTDRAVDQAAVQHRLLAGPTLAADEAARDLARRVELLLVVAGEGKEVDAFARLGRHDGGDEQHGVAHADDHRSRGLSGDPAGLHGQRPIADFDLCLVHCSSWAARWRGDVCMDGERPGLRLESG